MYKKGLLTKKRIYIFVIDNKIDLLKMSYLSHQLVSIFYHFIGLLNFFSVLNFTSKCIYLFCGELKLKSIFFDIFFFIKKTIIFVFSL